MLRLDVIDNSKYYIKIKLKMRALFIKYLFKYETLNSI